MQTEFETIDEAYNEVVRLRAENARLRERLANRDTDADRFELR